MKLTLHIGHYKTGSTAIQTYFDLHRTAYLDHGWLYPRAGRPTPSKPNHTSLPFEELIDADRTVARWYQRTQRYKAFKSGTAEPAKDRVLDEVLRENPDHLVLSSEEFMLFGGRTGVPAATARQLIEYFDPGFVRVVCFLRRPDHYLESWYNQLVKLGSSTTLNQQLPARLESVHVQYAQAVGYWKHDVGVDDVVVLRYDNAKSDVVTTLIEAIQAPVLAPDLRQEIPKDVNPRIPNTFVEVLRVLNPVLSFKGRAAVCELLTTLGEDPAINGVSVRMLDDAGRTRLHEVFHRINLELGDLAGHENGFLARLAGRPSGFFADLDDMLLVNPDALSAAEAFARWAPDVLAAVREQGLAPGWPDLG